MTIVLRGRLAPHVIAAALAAIASGIGAWLIGPRLGLPLPGMMVALVAGLAVLGWRYFGVYRRDGVALDDRGVRGLDGRVAVAWSEVKTLRFCSHPHPMGGQIALVRYAALEPAGGPPLAFCDKGPLGRIPIHTPHGRLCDVAESGLLIALVAERLRLAELLPPPPAPAAEPAPVRADDDAPASPAPTGVATVRTSYGLLPLLGKLGPKLGGTGAKLWQAVVTGAKTFKVGTAAVSLGAYSLFLSWQSAVALMLMLAWHEYGHVHAMRRCGIKVRGIYFIPFLGGAAVHEAPIPDRAEQAYVALNGPLWGFYLTLVPLAAFYLTGERHAWLAFCAALWAVLNLFNLLPILPLDGGRALSAIAYSINSSLGALIAFATLGLGVVLASVTRLGLLVIVIVVGALELTSEIAGAQRRRGFAALAAGPRLDFLHWYRLQSLARTVTAGQDAPRALARERGAFERTRALLRGRPMSRSQLAFWAVSYAVLAVALVLVILLVRHIPGADLVHGLLR